MPLLKGTKWQPKVKLPTSLDRNSEIFVIRFTKEAFQSIDEYYDRLDLYRSRCWTCAATKKSKLTYEEALLSEKMAKLKKRMSKNASKKKELSDRQSAKKVVKFPKEFAVPILTKIQFSTKNLNELIDDLKSYLINKAARGRTNGLPSKSTLKSFISNATERHRYRNSPFIIKKAYAKKFNLTLKEMPKKLLAAHQDHLQKLKKSNSSMKRKADSNSNSKRKTLKANGKQVRKIDKKKVKDVKLKKVRKKSKSDKKDKDKHGKKDKASKKDKNKTSKKDKKEILVEWPIPSRDGDPLPLILGDLLMSWKFLNTFGKCLKLYPFPFEHFQLAMSQSDLTNGSALCDLIVHSFTCLLSILFNEIPDDFQSKENLRNYRVINNHNWERAVVIYLHGLRESDAVINIPECIRNLMDSNCSRFSFSLSSFEARVQLLKVLTDLVVESVTIRQCLDDAVDDLHDLKRTWRVEKADVMRRLKENKSASKLDESIESENIGSGGDTSFDNKENEPAENEKKPIPVDREFEEQQLKRKETRFLNATSFQTSFLRHPYIGRDSSNRTYWFFDGSHAIGRLYVEDGDGQWTYYCTPKEVDTLILHLKSKGLKNENEKELYTNLLRDKENLSMTMQKHIDDIRRLTECRHSVRLQTILRDKPYLGYVNKYVNE